MSRMAQAVQKMTDELRKNNKKKGRAMEHDSEDLGFTDDFGVNEDSSDVNNGTAEGAVDIEPDAAPAAGAEAMETKKAKKNVAKKVSKTAKVAKVAKVAKPSKPAKAAKAAKALKAAKAPKTPKAPKAAKEAKPKVVIGTVPALGELGKVVGIVGGERNQFVNLEFSSGVGFKLWPSGYPEAEDRIKARDLMVAWLSKALL